jgi:hypothetical protein
MVSTLILPEREGGPPRALVHVGLLECDGWGVRQRVPTLDLISVVGDNEGLEAVSSLLPGGHGTIDVVIGIRPLWSFLPARYQWLVDDGLAEPFSAWIERLVEEHPHSGLDHGRLVSAWNEQLGAEHVHVVIDPTGVERVAEVVADLAGTMVVAEVPAGASTRARSGAAIEVRRRVNEAVVAPHSGVTPTMVREVEAVLAELPGPGPDDPGLSVPSHLMERLRPICEQAATCIESGGNAIAGELSALLLPPLGGATVTDHELTFAIDDAASLVHRLLLVDPTCVHRRA